MTPLSVVVITFNEEKKIAGCLDSVKDTADEIIVVDSYSTDRTEEICKTYPNVVFIRQKFLGYIEQKNFAKDQASHPLILSLDADEALDEVARKEVLEIKENPVADGYIWSRLNNYCGRWIRHGAWYPDRKLRLWKKGTGEWTGQNPHDRLSLETGKKTMVLKGHILHYTMSDVKEHIAQVNSFSTIAAEELFRKGKKAGCHHLVIHPAWRFFRDYFLKLGLLDGYYGLVIAANSAWSVFLKYAKLRMLTIQSRKSQNSI